MNWHENARHPLAGLALIVCDRRLVLVNNGLERIHQAHRYLDARHFLAEVELTDLRRLVRMNDGKSRLIQNDKLSRTVCRQLCQGIIKKRESDRTGHNTGKSTVFQHRNGDNGNNFSGDRRNDRFRDNCLLCLHNLLEVVTIRTISGIVV